MKEIFQLRPIIEQRRTRQSIEIASVVGEANIIEEFYNSQNIPFPKIINLFTAGFNKPETAKQIGTYGDDNFINFPPPDISGHPGTVSVDEDITFLNGRAHPYEWVGNENASTIISHPLQVWKEIARRQRARGIDPLFVFTYLVGVREGQVLKPGDVGLILDDTELTNIVHPGHGAREILDEHFGSRFQPKAGRSTNMEVAKAYVDFARKIGYKNLFPTVVCGTPGTTEYQSFFEVALLDAAFNNLKDSGLSNAVINTFSKEALGKLSLLYGMGVTAELATMRQTFPKEPDFRVLALGLATDSVGGSQSLVIDHEAVVKAALAAGEEHRDRLLQFEKKFDARLLQPIQDFSIQSKIKP